MAIPKVLGSNEVAGFADSKEKIIEILEGRPAGHEILPEEHQELALKVLNYVRSVELNAVSTLIGYADENTVPINPNNSNCAYIGSMGNGETKTYYNFHGRDGASIQITTDIDHAAVVILLWDWKMGYWSYHLAEITIAEIGDISYVVKFHPGFIPNFTVGGVKAGVEIPDGTSVLTVVKNMLFGYIAPTLPISSSVTSAEIGSSVNPTITYKGTNSSSATVTKLVLKIGSETLVTKANPSSGTAYTYNDSGITSNTTYKVEMTDDVKGRGSSATHDKSVSVTFYYKYFMGYVAKTGTSEKPNISTSSQVRGLSTKSNDITSIPTTIVGETNTNSAQYFLVVCVPSEYKVACKNVLGGDYDVQVLKDENNNVVEIAVNLGGGSSSSTKNYKVYYIGGTPSYKQLKITN